MPFGICILYFSARSGSFSTSMIFSRIMDLMSSMPATSAKPPPFFFSAAGLLPSAAAFVPASEGFCCGPGAGRSVFSDRASQNSRAPISS